LIGALIGRLVTSGWFARLPARQFFARLIPVPSADSAKMECRFFGGIFVLMRILVIVGGVHADKYHNLMRLIWGALERLAQAFWG
jgi:hypothetical protein